MRAQKEIFKILLAAAILLLAAAPGRSATYHVWGGVYAADPIPEEDETPPSILPGGLTDEEIVGEEELFPVGVLGMVRVEILDDSSGTVLASSLGILGPYYASFNIVPSTTTVRFSLRDAATNAALFETGPVDVAAGDNRRYLLVPLSVAEIGGVSIIPHPSGGSAYAFTRVGLVEAADIGADGLADYAGAAAHWRDAPFGRTLNIFGATSTVYYPWWGTGQYCYKIKVSPPSGPDYYINDKLKKTTYEVDTSASPPTVTSNQEDILLLGTAAGDCYRFTPLTAFSSTGNPIFWSFPDLLVSWNTLGDANGLHDLTLEVYNRILGGPPLTVTGAPLQIHVDNHSVELSFDQVEQRTSADVTQVDLIGNPCDLVNLSGGRKLFIEYTAHHPGGFLATYSLKAVRNLGSPSSLAGTSYDPSTMTPSGFPGVNPGTVNVVAADLPESCAYDIRLHAWARTTNGYVRLFHPWQHLTYYIQIP